MISIIVTCYNEADIIGEFIPALKKEISQIGEEFELIFVDNKSNDNTLKLFPLATKAGNVLATLKTKEEYNLLKEKQPNLSFITSNDIAALAYFLCSNYAKDITGSSINIDGGWTSQ